MIKKLLIILSISSLLFGVSTSFAQSNDLDDTWILPTIDGKQQAKKPLGPDDTHIGTPSPAQIWTPPEQPLPPTSLPIKTDRLPIVIQDPLPPISIPKSTDTGDPLVISFNNKSCTYKVYPDEMHPSRLNRLDLYNDGTEIILSRNLCIDSFYLVLDKNLDDKLTNGNELLFTGDIVYENLKKYDSNQNGFFDYQDQWASYARLLDHNGDLHFLDEFGIVGFSTDYTKVFNDMHQIGRYADCKYQGELFYTNCKQVSDVSGFRILAYNTDGVITTHGIYPSYGAYMSSVIQK